MTHIEIEYFPEAGFFYLKRNERYVLISNLILKQEYPKQQIVNIEASFSDLKLLVKFRYICQCDIGPIVFLFFLGSSKIFAD